MFGALLKTILVATLLASSATEGLTCSCAHRSTREKFRQAELVFVGSVTDVRPSTSADPMFIYAVTLSVEKQWKGPTISKIEVLWAFDNPHMCGDLPIVKGERYLIYADRAQGNYVVYPDCSPSGFAKDREEEITKLNSRWFRLKAQLFPFPK